MQMPTSDEVRRLEEEIAGLKARLAQLRRSQVRAKVADYRFTRPNGTAVALSELFEGKTDLVTIHNMGRSCPYCTLWADGFNGIVDHLRSRTAVVLISPDAPEVVGRFAAGRGWRFAAVSAVGNTFNKDVGFEAEPGKCWPGISCFRRDPDGAITRVSCATFGPGDDFCSAWHIFDLLADGANGWEPRYSY